MNRRMKSGLGGLSTITWPLFVTPLGNDAIIRTKVQAAKISVGDWGDAIAVSPDVKVHFEPCHHWSARGLKNLLVEAGFDEGRVQSHQWGNRHAASRNLETPWPPEYCAGDDLTNDPDFPVVSWAMAQKG